MKFVWILVLVLVLGALFVFLQPDAPTRMHEAAREQEEELLNEAESSMTVPIATVDAPATTPIESAHAIGGTSVNPELLAQSRALSAELAAANAARSQETPEGEIAAIADQPRALITDLPIGVPKAIEEGKMRVIPSKFERLADGTIIADEVWKITGDGSVDNPYCVSWEFLASAADTYTPRVDDFGFPQRILLLHGKHIRVAGYLAFPLVAPTSSECLVMLNQWDGCCIGVPPTPYDAVEVQLQSPIPRSRRHAMAYGTVEGVFEVEPYIVESWLVGLYMLKDSLVEQGL
ncbi:MAG: hypothetical protein EXS10_03750 [Phycisphaerales bacterium]|nr:hypothetical protein [Phycisphaerales bacterium]